MGLQNLLEIGSLAEHTTDAAQVQKVLAAAQRSIADAREQSISPETRLDAAYRAIMQASMVALWVNGFRPAKSAPGHHMTMIQSLTQSIGLDRDEMLVLDTFRVKRNAIDYSGDDVDEASVAACIESADSLIEFLSSWLNNNKPELIT